MMESVSDFTVEIEDDDLFSERLVALDLTTRCNLRCPYCFCYKVKIENELKFDEVITLLSDLYEMGVTSVGFSGGEPTIRKDFVEIVETIGGWGMGVNVQTNGCLLTEENLEKIVPFLRGAGVSIDGPPDVHNNLRPGFDTSVKTVERFVESGIRTTINTSLMTLNWDYLDYLLDLALEKHVDSLKIHPVLRLDYNKDIEPHYFLPEDRFESFYSWLIEQSLKTMGRCRLLTSLKPRKRILEHPCEASACWGDQCHSNLILPPAVIIIQADGTVMPDEVVPERFKMGSIREESISTIVGTYFGSENHKTYLRLQKYCFETYIQNSSRTIVDWKQYEADEARSTRFEEYRQKTPIQGDPSAVLHVLDMNSARPLLDPKVTVDEKGQNLITPDKKLIEINEITRKVISHCNGQHSVEDIVHLLEKDDDITWNVDWRHIGNVVRFLHRMKVIDAEGGGD